MPARGPFVSLLGAVVGALLLGGGEARGQTPVTLTAPDGAVGDKLGVSVSLDGDCLIAGASGANIGTAADGGAAYIRRWNGVEWEFEQKLQLPDPASLDSFGFEVGVRGDLCVVGVPGRKLLLKNSAGALSVYRRIAGTWTFQQLITAVDAASFDLFGGQFALTHDRIVVGVSAKDVSLQSQQGEVYVYRFDGTSFVLEQQLFASDGAAGDRFGASVDIDGTHIVVGAPGDDSGTATDTGAVYVFRLVGNTWVERQKIVPADALSLDGFGTSVAVDSVVLVGGAPAADPNRQLGRGAAWAYRNDGNEFTAPQKLLAADGLAGDAFGTSVEADGNVIVVGAPRDDVQGKTDVGSAWLFRFTAGTWSGELKPAPADISAAGQFGACLAMDGALVLVGAPNDTVGAFAVQGSVSVMKTLPAGWDWVGRSLIGSKGSPDLIGWGALTGGTVMWLMVDNAPPQTGMTLCISPVQIAAPFKGGVLVPAPDMVLFGLTTDVSGELPVGAVWPVGIPAGFPITYQAWLQDSAASHGFSATNAITSTAP